MRLRLGTALALTLALGIVVAPSSTATASCGTAADTTWIDPVETERSDSWTEPANWTGGVPDATSHVCIPPDTEAWPEIASGVAVEADVIDARGANVTVGGALTVHTSFDVSTIHGGGRLYGPGTARVSTALERFDLTLRDRVTVVLTDHAELNTNLNVEDGSRVEVRGDVGLGNGTQIATHNGPMGDGLLLVTETGSLRLHGHARVDGPFVNHGEVHVESGRLTLLVPEGEELYSTGRFSATPPAILDMVGLELRSGAVVDHANPLERVRVPEGHTVTLSGTVVYAEPRSQQHAITGGGEVAMVDDSLLIGSVGDSLTLTVPAGEVMRVGDASLEDAARLQVYGELAQTGLLNVEDEAVLDVYGTHRSASQWAAVGHESSDPGLEVIHPGGRFESTDPGSLAIWAPFVNHGTVRSVGGFVAVAPFTPTPGASTGTFRSEPGSEGVYLGSDQAGDPALELEGATLEGPIEVTGEVQAQDTDVRGQVTTAAAPRDDYRAGQLLLSGTTTLADGASLSGDVQVAGRLDADAGPTGTATLDAATVTGTVRAVSGTLDVPALAASTLDEQDTLRSGSWSSAPGARLQLPPVTTNQADLTWEGAGATIGGLGGLVNGDAGSLDLRAGADLSLPGRLRNLGLLRLSSGSRLDTDGAFRQAASGRLSVAADAAGAGRVRVAGRRDLAGDLVVRRDPAYDPRVGTRITVLTSPFRAGRADAFDRVLSLPYGKRRLRVTYGRARVQLLVARLR